MLRVYYAQIPETDPETRAFPLSEYRIRKLETIQAPLLRKQMLAAELLLIQAVRDWDTQVPLPLAIGNTEKGKPYFINLPLSFNLSHSGLYAACAFGDRDIGLDIQILSKASEKLCGRFFTENERRYLRDCSDTDRAYTRIWCMKESYIKLLGEGLRVPLESFSVSPEQLSLDQRPDVHFWLYEETDFEMALCICGEIGQQPEFIKTELRL